MSHGPRSRIFSEGMPSRKQRRLAVHKPARKASATITPYQWTASGPRLKAIRCTGGSLELKRELGKENRTRSADKAAYVLREPASAHGLVNFHWSPSWGLDGKRAFGEAWEANQYWGA